MYIISSDCINAAQKVLKTTNLWTIYRSITSPWKHFCFCCEFHEMLIQESTGGSIQGNYSCSSTTQRCGSRTFMGRLVVARLDACHCQLCGSTKPSASAYEVHITWTWLERGIWCRGQSFLIRRSPENVHGPFTWVLKISENTWHGKKINDLVQHCQRRKKSQRLRFSHLQLW